MIKVLNVYRNINEGENKEETDLINIDEEYTNENELLPILNDANRDQLLLIIMRNMNYVNSIRKKG